MIYAANLKCNHTRASFNEYANKLNSALKDTDKVMVFPPFSAFCENKFKFILGAQNFYPAINGSFTGEIGADMLNEFGIRSVLIGHSERRILAENDTLLKNKFNFAKERGWDIVYCIGESDIVRMNGSTAGFLSSQLEIIDVSYENLIIAYEPIWAIGTGKSASINQIAEVLEQISDLTKAPLLYGGSVNLGNIKEILSVPKCSGVLVGTASWEVDNFIQMIKG